MVENLHNLPLRMANGAEMTLLRFETVTLDLDRMSLDATVPLALTVTGDGDAAVTLQGPWPAGEVEVSRNGSPFGRIPVIDGAVTLSDDFSGENDYTFVPTNP